MPQVIVLGRKADKAAAKIDVNDCERILCDGVAEAGMGTPSPSQE
jgi:hypothetical protein